MTGTGQHCLQFLYGGDWSALGMSLPGSRRAPFFDIVLEIPDRLGGFVVSLTVLCQSRQLLGGRAQALFTGGHQGGPALQGQRT